MHWLVEIEDIVVLIQSGLKIAIFNNDARKGLWLF